MTEPDAVATSNGPRFALLTKSYLPDLERCELLVDSVQRCCPDFRHYLVVDRVDVPAFRHLGDRAELIVSEDLLPFWTYRSRRRGIWVSRHFPYTRGWMMQQVLKIEAASQLDADMFVCCDSDVAFVRPFSPPRLMTHEDGRDRFGLLDVEFDNDDVTRWTEFACELLGVDVDTIQARGHVGELVCWSQAHVRGMIDRIAEVADAPWFQPLVRARTFSEYILYGVYVREVLGYPASSHFPSTDPLCLGLWEADVTPERIERFFTDELSEENLAVMIYSKGGVSPADYRSLVERCWDTW